MRILIVEDDVRLQESVAELLRAAGYAVDVTATGDEGLWYGEEYPIDLAIVDLGLPGMSGIELIRALRGSSVRFPILILTARSDWQDKVEGLEAGADDYLTKPFHPEELKARVSALLRRAAGHAHPEVSFG
ncbi:MAG: response regulator, partial [Gammaproteobacteria bacterium]